MYVCILSGCAFVVAKEVFHHRNGNILKLWEWLNDEKNCNYVNKHLYPVNNFNHFKLKYTLRIIWIYQSKLMIIFTKLTAIAR